MFQDTFWSTVIRQLYYLSFFLSSNFFFFSSSTPVSFLLLFSPIPLSLLFYSCLFPSVIILYPFNCHFLLLSLSFCYSLLPPYLSFSTPVSFLLLFYRIPLSVTFYSCLFLSVILSYPLIPPLLLVSSFLLLFSPIPLSLIFYSSLFPSVGLSYPLISPLLFLTLSFCYSLLPLYIFLSFLLSSSPYLILCLCYYALPSLPPPPIFLCHLHVSYPLRRFSFSPGRLPVSQ
jgi:hypothetical protein